jgi:hypothetical protein
MNQKSTLITTLFKFVDGEIDPDPAYGDDFPRKFESFILN